MTFIHRVSFVFMGLFLAMAVCLPSQNVLADSFDWRDINGENWLTPVKSQFGGTCWAFGSTGAFETHYKLTRNDVSYNADMSEQQVVWETNPDMGSTGGGYGDGCTELHDDSWLSLGSGMPISAIQSRCRHHAVLALGGGLCNPHLEKFRQFKPGSYVHNSQYQGHVEVAGSVADSHRLWK